MLTKLFVSKFIKNREILRDLLHSFLFFTSRQGVDYAIILPDEDTFLEVISDMDETSRVYFIPPKVYFKGGHDTIVSSVGLVINGEKHLRVYFSYFQGRLAGSHCKIFTVLVLFFFLKKIALTPQSHI